MHNIPESARLDARELDAPLRLDLLGNRLGEALHSPLAGAVDAEERHADLSTDARHLLDETARGLLLAHDLHGFPRDGNEAEEVHVHLRLDLGVGQLLEWAAQAVAGVVDDDIDALEGGEGLGEGSVDICRLGDVECEGEEVLRPR